MCRVSESTTNYAVFDVTAMNSIKKTWKMSLGFTVFFTVCLFSFAQFIVVFCSSLVMLNFLLGLCETVTHILQGYLNGILGFVLLCQC